MRNLCMWVDNNATEQFLKLKIEVIVKAMAESAVKSAENPPPAAEEESMQSEGRQKFDFCEYS